MTKKRLVLTDAAEAAVVNAIEVRLARPEEVAEWDRLMVEHHYLKSATMVGEQLRYVAEYRGQWMALLGWSAAGQTLLERLDLEGTIALMDALHTQVETARAVVQEGGGDYVLFVKGNQEGLQNQARHFLPEDSSPSTPEGGTGARADRVAGDCGQERQSSADGLSARGASGAH